jgi:hypothetical protein
MRILSNKAICTSCLLLVLILFNEVYCRPSFYLNQNDYQDLMDENDILFENNRNFVSINPNLFYLAK